MFQINSGMENFMQKKEISLFSVGKFFSHSAEKFREGNHSTFQKYSGIEKILCIRSGCHFFCYNFFLLSVPKNFVGGINQCFRIIKAWKIFPQKKELSLFSVGTFFSQSAEKLREGNHSMFRKNSGMEKLYAEGGDITLSAETFFLTVPKNFMGGIIQGFKNIRALRSSMQKK